MNEEEIIEILKSPLLKSDGYERHQRAIDGLLDLYQKEKEKNYEQSNIIFCLKAENTALKIRLDAIKGVDALDVISKDKIKAKIEEYKKAKDKFDFASVMYDKVNLVVYVLEELLKEEE